MGILYFDKVRAEIARYKQKKEEGKDIIIPFPFPKFSQEVPGIMKGIYTIFSANQKAGKTQGTDYMFMYNPIEFVRTKDTNIDVKIKYFSLEMSKDAKFRQAIVHRLFMKKGIILTTRQLRSLFDEYVLSDEMLRFIDEEREWFEFFESKVDIIDNIKNPFGIYNEIRNFCHNNGKYYNHEGGVIPLEDIKKNDLEINKSISHFDFDNPDLFVIPIVDHASLLTPEKVNGRQGTTYDAIGDLSTKYLVSARNRWNISPILVQQQTLEKEGNESAKLDRHEPSASGLADNKTTSKDCDVLITLYEPFRNKVKTYRSYDITRLKNHYRRLAVELDREGATFETSLYFNGKVNFFKELPKANEMTDDIYKRIEKEEIYP